jgi:hypothetical protein
MTTLLIIAILLGAWCVFLIWKHETPFWFCVMIGAVWGLAYGLLIFDLIAGPL